MSLLAGVPAPSDVNTIVTVRALALSPTGAELTSDQFSVRVTDDKWALPPSEVGGADDRSPRPVTCLPTSAVTTATVVIAADGDAATGRERASTVRAFAGHLLLPVAAVTYLPASNDAVDDRSALVAGVGDAADRAGPRVILRWEVGCGNVLAEHLDRLERLEGTAGDGSMSAAVGRGVVGWHVATRKPPEQPRRRRRATYRFVPTATPVVAVSPPTSRPVPTRTVTEPDPTRVPPPPTTLSTTESQPRQTRRRRTRRPRPGRATTPLGAQSSLTTVPPPYVEPEPIFYPESTSTLETTTSPYVEPSVPAVRDRTPSRRRSTAPPFVEPSQTEFSTTRARVTTPTPTLPRSPTSDLHWTGVPLRLRLNSNQIVRRPIPDDLFGGGAPGPLGLRLLTADGLVASQWLRLDRSARRLIGMPLDTHIGQSMYILEATDSVGRVARATVMVEVRRTSVSGSNVAFESSAKLGLDYFRFSEDVHLRLDVIGKIAGGFGDRDASQLTVTRVVPGSVVVAWTNSSVRGDSVCPLSTLVDLRSRMLSPDGSVSPQFRSALHPYRVLAAEMVPRGACATESLGPPAPSSTAIPDPVPPQKVTEPDRVVTIVVPLIILIVCVIIAIIVACVLIRRRRGTQKSSSPDKAVKPGAPVIFASELDDNGASPPSKPLIGLGGERAPAPPDYLAATAGTPPVHDHRRPLLASEQMSPLRYQPPPGSALKQPAIHSTSSRR